MKGDLVINKEINFDHVPLVSVSETLKNNYTRNMFS